MLGKVLSITNNDIRWLITVLSIFQSLNFDRSPLRPLFRGRPLEISRGVTSRPTKKKILQVVVPEKKLHNRKKNPADKQDSCTEKFLSPSQPALWVVYNGPSLNSHYYSNGMKQITSDQAVSFDHFINILSVVTIAIVEPVKNTLQLQFSFLSAIN